MKSQRIERLRVDKDAAQCRLAGWVLGIGGGAAGFWPLTALACSGPGAAAAIADSMRVVLVSLSLTVGWLLAALLVPPLRRRVGRKGLLLLAATCVVHPGLWLSTLRGDCGYTARWASLLFLPVLALVLGYLLRRRGDSAAGPGPGRDRD